MSLFTIKFLITCQTQFGEVVYICGSTPELGNWNPENAMRLYTDATVYPRWDPYRTISVRQGNKLLFKVCIVNQDKIVRWEGIAGNREIVASENLLVEFTAHFDEIAITPMVDEIAKPPRKKTCDILNQLQSDGSSSKEYWKQYMQEEEESVLYITLTTQMRRIIENQIEPFFGLNEFGKTPSSHQSDTNLLQKIERTRQMLHTTSNFYCILEGAEHSEPISVMGQDSYLINASDFPTYSIHNNTVPIVFHVESLRHGHENASCAEIFTGIERIVHAENILLGEKNKKIQYYVSVRMAWEPNRELVQLLVKKKVALVFVESEHVLQTLLTLILSLNLSYHIQDSNQIIILLNHMAIMKIKFTLPHDPKFSSLAASKKQRSQSQTLYFSAIKKTLLDSHSKSFVGNSKEAFIETVKEDETFVALAHHRKNLLVLNAEKIEDFTSKLLTEIISLSSKSNFEVYIILDKMSIDIKAKFPASKNNKIVVLGKSGTLYANQNTFIDMFLNLNLQKQKFSQVMSKVHYSMNMGIESTHNLSVFECLYHFKTGHVGSLGAKMLKQKIHQHNQASVHKLSVEQKEERKFVVRPFCLTEEFYLKAILQNLAKFSHEDRSLVLNVNMKNSNTFFLKSTTLFNTTFKQKHNIKIRNIQVLPPLQTEYPGLVKEQAIPISYLEAELEFMCEHFLAGSHIKSYKLDMLSPHRNRGSFANKIKPKDHYETY